MIKERQISTSQSTQDKLKIIKLILMKICRETGEDEYETLIVLENNFNIIITDEEIEELRLRNVWIWIKRPFNELLYKQIEQKVKNMGLPVSKFLKILESNGKRVLKYPERIIRFNIHDDIFETMREEYGIKDSFLNCYEWENLQNTSLWYGAEIQIARELIADKVKKNLKLLNKH